jgi:hypothetical protein
METVIGKFEWERSTKNTEVYVRHTETGRKEAQYVPKSVFAGTKAPKIVEVVVRTAE